MSTWQVLLPHASAPGLGNGPENEQVDERLVAEAGLEVRIEPVGAEVGFGVPFKPVADAGFGVPFVPVAADGLGLPFEPVTVVGLGAPFEPLPAVGLGVPFEPLPAVGFGMPLEPVAAVGFGVPLKPVAAVGFEAVEPRPVVELPTTLGAGTETNEVAVM